MVLFTIENWNAPKGCQKLVQILGFFKRKSRARHACVMRNWPGATLKRECTLIHITFQPLDWLQFCFHHSLQLNELKRMVYVSFFRKKISVSTFFSILRQSCVIWDPTWGIPISLPSPVLQNTKWPPLREPHKYAHLVNCIKATFHVFRGSSSLANFSKLPHNPQIATDSRALFFSAIPCIPSLRPHAFWSLLQRSLSL